MNRSKCRWQFFFPLDPLEIGTKKKNMLKKKRAPSFGNIVLIGLYLCYYDACIDRRYLRRIFNKETDNMAEHAKCKTFCFQLCSHYHTQQWILSKCPTLKPIPSSHHNHHTLSFVPFKIHKITLMFNREPIKSQI